MNVNNVDCVYTVYNIFVCANDTADDCLNVIMIPNVRFTNTSDHNILSEKYFLTKSRLFSEVNQ